MKKVIAGICLIACLAVFVFGFTLVYGKGTTYEFQQIEFIENYTEGDFSMASKPVQNSESSEKNIEIKDFKIDMTFKSNVKLNQGQFRLIEKETGKSFSKAFKYTADPVSGKAEPKTYSWAVFEPEVSKITGNIIKREGDKEVKTYVEIVYPKKDPSNAKRILGKFEFKNSAQRPAEKLS